MNCSRCSSYPSSCNGADSWVAMENATQQNFHVTVMKLYKRLARVKADYDHLTDDEILTKVHLPSPSELLRRARLRYFVTLVKAEHEDAWTLLARDSAWRQLLEEDMVWMWKQLYHTSELKDPREHYPQWFLVVQDLPQALEKPRQEGMRALHATAPADFARSQPPLPCAAAPFGDSCQSISNRKLRSSRFLRCLDACNAGWDARARQERMHTSSKDMGKSPGCACYAIILLALAVLKHFHTMQKLKGHVRHSARCRETLDGRNMDCPLVPGCGSTDDAERELTHDRLLPPIQCEGPQPPETRRRQRPDMDGEL